MPGVGIGIIIFNDENKILLIKRNEDATLADSAMRLEGTWTLPAGKVKLGETLFEAAKRKVLEEVNLEIDDLKIISISDDINEFAHFLTIGISAGKSKGNIDLGQTLEHIKFGYYSIDELPMNLCEPSKIIIDNFKEKRIYKGEN